MKPMSGLAPIASVLRQRNYRLYVVGMAPGLITLWMQRVGVGWLAWELTHSTTWLGVIAAANLAPVILLAPLAGAFVDRRDAVKVMRISQALQVLQAALLAGLTLAGAMTIWLLFALAIFLGLTAPFFSTARFAVVPRTIPRELYPTGIALDSSLFNGSGFVGPALAGLLIPVTGVAGTFVANAIGGFVFSLALGMLRLEPLDQAGRREHKFLGDVVEGFAYVRAHAGIGPLFMLLVCVSVCVRPLQDMMPGFAGAVFKGGAVYFAWLTSAMGVGAMASAFWISVRGHLSGLTYVVLIGCLGLGLSVFGIVLSPVIWVAVGFAATTGFCFNNMSTSIQALTQSVLADDQRGRVMGLYTLIYRGLPAIGELALGVVAEWVGLQWVFGIAAGLLLLALAMVVPRRRSMRAALEVERAAPAE